MGNTEPCTAVSTLFTVMDLTHPLIIGSEPMACDFELTYTLAGLMDSDNISAPLVIFQFNLHNSGMLCQVCASAFFVNICVPSVR